MSYGLYNTELFWELYIDDDHMYTFTDLEGAVNKLQDMEIL